MIASGWPAPPVAWRSYIDAFGNVCDRLSLPLGDSTIRYDALVDVTAAVDDVDEAAAALLIENLPDDTLVYLLASRFCLPDLVADGEWELFGWAEPGWERVQAICDGVHGKIQYQAGSSTAVTTAVDVLDTGAGVCLDFTHVGITFCRALNIPACYVAGYLPDIGVEPRRSAHGLLLVVRGVPRRTGPSTPATTSHGWAGW